VTEHSHINNNAFCNNVETYFSTKHNTYVGIRRLRGGLQSYSDLASELAVSRDAA